jgi:thioester reductase-like protein
MAALAERDRGGTVVTTPSAASSESAGGTMDLAADAVLDPEIRPSATNDGAHDFAAASEILLTGASGFLGAYLLRDLLATTSARVWCVVRCLSESDGANRIEKNLLKYGLWNEDFKARIVAVPGDLAEPLLGLGADTFDRLAGVAEAIFHNGAMVNFIFPYANLKEPNVGGTREVIRLACRGRRKALHFVSTIGVFPPATKPHTRILESDTAATWQGLIGGYQQSKWVAEKIVNIAADRGLPVRIYRPGFVAGGTTTGIWNTDDLLPRMIKGCIQLGMAPDTDALLELVPVDYVSRAIVHLSSRPALQFRVFHVVNPNYISAKEFLRIVDSLGYPMSVVPYPEWRNALIEDCRTSTQNALYPLLTLFTGDTPLERVAAFDCARTLEGLKETDIACPRVDANLMGTYLSYFKRSGFVSQ